MLNYNLNVNSPLQQEKKNEDVRPEINWSFQSFATASDSTDLGELGFATMSINAPGSTCIQISNDNSGTFTTDAQFPVTASLTGSNWPITGSTTMSLFTAGITYDPASVNQFYFSAISASALNIYNNPSYTASVLLNEFSASEFFRFFTEGRVFHTKGNIFNPVINFLARNQSPSTDTGNVNGFTASFNIVKNSNESLVSLPQVTGSKVGAFNNQYALNITSSLSASVSNNTTGSTTMSIVIPEAGISTSSLLFNSSSAGLKTISASFVASQNTPYNITASVIMNKGNIFNATLNVLSTGSNADSYSMFTTPSQFNIFKDVNVNLVVVNQNVNLLSHILTASKTNTLQTQFAFNFESEVTESNTYPIYQVFTYPSTSLDITPAGTSSIRFDSASIFSHTEFPYTSSYNITASAFINKIPSFAVNLIVIAGGGAGAGGTTIRPGGGGGAGGYFQNDIQIIPNKTYTIDYVGKGGISSTSSINDGGATGSNTQVTIFEGLYGQPTTSSIVAIGGNGAGYPTNVLFTNFKDGGISGYAYKFSNVTLDVVTLVNNFAGGIGGVDVAGGGGGQTNDGVQGNGGYLLGGAGGSNDGYQAYSGSFAPTSSFQGNTLNILTGSSGFGVLYPNNNGNAATAYGGGGGGGSATTTGTTIGGAGGNGVVIVSYSGSQKLTGGDVSFANGITSHTFTSTGSFIYALEPKPNPAEQPYQFRTDTLLIAGGGSGGSDEGGGGGAGGYSYNPYLYYEPFKTYSINVGAGQPGINVTTGSVSGSNSYIVDTSNAQTLILAKGGGCGFGAVGGSGGGASNAGGGGGADNGLNVNPNYYVKLFQSQGNIGGNADPNFGQAGGGGGAANSGSNGTGNPSAPGVGGIGKFDLSFAPIGVCGGGNSFDGDNGDNVNIFGGGAQCVNAPNSGSAAPANRGGGGGGARGPGKFGGAGGSGKVQILYAGTQRAAGGQIETGLISGSYYTLHTFTASGNFIPNS